MASDLIYREDAKDFVRHAYHKGLNPIDYLDEVPAADVRPVVYCKDCKHSDAFSSDCAESTFPLKCLSVRYGGVFPLCFCEHGERNSGSDLRKVVEIDQVKEGAE